MSYQQQYQQQYGQQQPPAQPAQQQSYTQQYAQQYPQQYAAQQQEEAQQQQLGAPQMTQPQAVPGGTVGGVVSSFNLDRGFGFIVMDGGENLRHAEPRRPPFVHVSHLQLATRAGRLKTKLCSQFAQGECALGAGCAFAHGEDDLRAGPCPAPPPPPQPPLLLQQLRGQTAFDGPLLPSTGQPPSMAPPLPRLRSRILYRCPDCGQEFTAWSLCRQHVLEAGHADASNTKGLQQRCMASPSMAPPPMALGCTGCAAGAPMLSAPGRPTHVPYAEDLCGVEYALQRWGPSAAYPWEEAAVRRAAEAFGENTAAVPRALHGENTAESSTVQSTTSGPYRSARKREREADEQSGAVEGAAGENATAEQAAMQTEMSTAEQGVAGGPPPLPNAAASKIKHRATIRALPTYKPNGAPHTSARAPFGWRELKQEMTQRCKFEDRPCELLFVDVDDATGDHAALACNHTHPTCNHTHPTCSATTRIPPATTHIPPATTRIAPATTRIPPATTRIAPATTRIPPVAIRIQPEATHANPACDRRRHTRVRQP